MKSFITKIKSLNLIGFLHVYIYIPIRPNPTESTHKLNTGFTFGVTGFTRVDPE